MKQKTDLDQIGGLIKELENKPQLNSTEKEKLSILRARKIHILEAKIERMPRATICISEESHAQSTAASPSAMTFSAPAIQTVDDSINMLESPVAPVRDKKERESYMKTVPSTSKTKTSNIPFKRQDDNEFEIVNHGSNKRKKSADAENPAETSVSSQKSASKTPPPIFLKNVASWKAISIAVHRAGIRIKSSRNIKDSVKMQPENIDDYKKLQSLLSSLQAEFYTFRLKEEKPIQVIIREILTTVNPEDVVEELKSLDIPTLKAFWFGFRKSVMAVHVERNEEVRKIFDITDLLYLKVKVEGKKRSSAPGQCHRCQNFSHSSGACQIQWRCVRCGENHSSAMCTKKNKEGHQAKCANCGGEHPANYKGCSHFKQAVQTALTKKSYATVVNQKSKVFMSEQSVNNATPSLNQSTPDTTQVQTLQEASDRKTQEAIPVEKETNFQQKTLKVPAIPKSKKHNKSKTPSLPNKVKKNLITKKSSETKTTKPKPTKNSNAANLETLIELLSKFNINKICASLINLLEKLGEIQSPADLIKLFISLPNLFNNSDNDRTY